MLLFLDKGRVYEVKDESDAYYFMAHDGRNWLKSRFEVVKDEEQMTHRQKMKEDWQAMLNASPLAKEG